MRWRAGLVDLRCATRWPASRAGPTARCFSVETPDGPYRLHAEWLLACDGARSPVREALGLPSSARSLRDRFLIADIVIEGDLPAERRFWFDPPFHPGQSVLLHKQPDDVWRIDFQLGWDADPEAEKQPENVIPRIAPDARPRSRFELEWVSVYTFRCRRLERFRHGRTIFLGDTAHQVCPFGARGGNGGVQDADNLGWKLAAVLDGKAPRPCSTATTASIRGGDENILNSTRSTDFITPKFPASRAYRDAALTLAPDFPFARALINSGRLSVPTQQLESPLDTPDRDGDWVGGPGPGRAMLDAPVGNGWLIDRLGRDFSLLTFGKDDVGPAPSGATAVPIAGNGLAWQRYDSRPGTTYLIRPDRYVAARWRTYDPAAVSTALDRATGRSHA